MSHSEGGLQGQGFGAYADRQGAAFGSFPASDGPTHFGKARATGSGFGGAPSWSFQDLQSKTNTNGQGNHDAHNSGANTPAASSSGSVITPPSMNSSPPLQPMAAQKSLKRGRQSFGNAGQASKTMRATPSPAATRPDTPSSRDSSDLATDLPEELIKIIGGDPMEMYRKMKEYEKAAADRRERERLDEEYARNLQAELDGGPLRSSYPSSSFAGPSNRTSNPTQSYLESSGGIRRANPLLSELPGAGNIPSFSSQFPSAQLSPRSSYPQNMQPFPPSHSQVKEETTPNWPQSRPQPQLRNPDLMLPPLKRKGDYIDIGSDSDEDISVIDGSGFVPNARRSNADSVVPADSYMNNRPSTGGSMAGDYDNVPIADLTGSSPITHRFRDQALPQLRDGFHGVSGNNVYGQESNSNISSMFNPFHPAESNNANMVYGMLDNHIDSYGSPSSGYAQGPSSVYDSMMPQGMPGSWAPDVGSSHNPFNLDDDLFPNPSNYWSRNSYVQADPSKTAEELKNLMNHIRPDEELGTNDLTGSPEDMADGCGLYEHQKLGLAWMSNMEEGSNKGGILADDMGLGKTIQAIALMVTRRSQDPKCKTTLIVAPVALMKQWESEIKIKVRSNKRLSTYTYHGAKKNTKWQELRNYDVVLTTFGTLASEKTRKDKIELAKKNNPNWIPTTAADQLPLLGDECRFFRVILDEAQNIKNKNTKSALATYDVKALTRFCMTGTPMMNNVGELFSLIHFLRIRPYCEWDQFNKDFIRPLRGESISNTDEAMRRLQAFLKAVLLRRTKKSEINGKPILTLPERTTVIDHAIFDEDQLSYYQGLERQTAVRFNKYRDAGTIGRNYSNALVLLLRLRQACCHPHLIRDFAEGQDAPTDLTPEDLENMALELTADAVRRIRDEGIIDCPICMDVVQNSTIFIPCGHRTCSECFARISDPSQVMDDVNTGDNANRVFKCMTCRGSVNPKRVTDWSSFQKVHMADPNDALKDSLDSEADIETESGSDGDSDSDSDGSESDEDETLGGFIVNDEEIDDDKSTESEPSGAQPAESSGPMSKVKKGKQPAKMGEKKKSRKSSKGKGKGKKKDEKSRSGKKKEKKTLSQLQKEGRRNLKAKQKYLKRLREGWVSSCKVDKCMEILNEIQQRDGDEKTIVFSQFTTMLDLLEIPISERGWSYKRYDGSMAPTARNEAVIEFTSKRRCKIMLVSLKAGNSGLNLTAANNVVMFDPFWNPYIEEQAVDRAHRIGQRRPVQVHRLLVQDTVEDRIVKLQEKKRAMIEGALDERASQTIARLGVQELAFLFVSDPEVWASSIANRAPREFRTTLECAQKSSLQHMANELLQIGVVALLAVYRIAFWTAQTDRMVLQKSDMIPPLLIYKTFAQTENQLNADIT